MLSDSLTDAHGAGLCIQTPCVELKLHQISQSGTFVFENSFFIHLLQEIKKCEQESCKYVQELNDTKNYNGLSYKRHTLKINFW